MANEHGLHAFGGLIGLVVTVKHILVADLLCLEDLLDLSLQLYVVNQHGLFAFGGLIGLVVTVKHILVADLLCLEDLLDLSLQ